MESKHEPTDKVSLLSAHWLLQHLSPSELETLAQHARMEKHAANKVIFWKGDPGHSMMVVVKGRVRIRSYSAQGKEVILNIINPGEVLGEIALLDGKERTADAIAMGPVEVLVLARRDFLPFLERNQKACIRLLTVLCDRLRRTSEQVEDLLFLEQPARLAKTLLRLAKENEYAPDDDGEEAGLCVDLKLSQKELGAVAGMRRESVNRHLQEWRADGLITLKDGLIWINDPDALEGYVEEAE